MGDAVVAGQALADRIRNAHRKYLFPAVKPYYDEPLVLTSGQGVWVQDAEGREFLDLFSGILTLSVGHCHPRVVERIKAQAETLGHTSTLYVTEPQVRVAEQLASLAPGDLEKSFFTNSGTEALETAIMAACIYTGRSEVIAFRHSYHGRSYLATNMGASGGWRPLASSIAGIKHVKAPYCYRSPWVNPCDEAAAEVFVQDLVEVIETTTNGQPAAFVVEPILGVGGYIVPPPGYFQKAAEVIRSYGGLFISDEVQTGFGRTGRWWGIQNWDVEPDIMYMAKGIASGAPVGATIARPEIADAWSAKTISTYGGTPVSMAAAAATLEIMVEEDVPTRSIERGRQLHAAMETLYERFDWVGEVRGMGLMQAIELVEDRESKEPASALAKAVLEAAKDEGLLIGLAGVSGNVVRMAPSMLITEDEMAEAVERLERAFERVAAAREKGQREE